MFETFIMWVGLVSCLALMLVAMCAAFFVAAELLPMGANSLLDTLKSLSKHYREFRQWKKDRAAALEETVLHSMAKACAEDHEEMFVKPDTKPDVLSSYTFTIEGKTLDFDPDIGTWTMENARVADEGLEPGEHD